MYQTKRFQNRITAGRLTLPVALLLTVACWLLAALLLPAEDGTEADGYPLWRALAEAGLPAWTDKLCSFLLYSLVGYFLIELNNVYALIRMRASVQTTIYFLLIAACPGIQRLYAGSTAAMPLLIALFFLFRSYQKQQPMADLFHAFVSLGIGSLFLPQLTLLAPLFWIGAYHFQSLRIKSFCASLVGWSMPYWFLLGHAYFYGEMELFRAPFRELAHFAPLVGGGIELWEVVTVGYLFVLFVVSAVHCFLAGYEDKLRTRSYLSFLVFFCSCLFVCIVLQPPLASGLLPLLAIGISILAGHLFILTHSRGMNIFFIGMLAGLFLLFVFNLWMLW